MLYHPSIHAGAARFTRAAPVFLAYAAALNIRVIGSSNTSSATHTLKHWNHKRLRPK